MISTQHFVEFLPTGAPSVPALDSWIPERTIPPMERTEPTPYT